VIDPEDGPRLLWTTEAAARRLSIGRTALYGLLRSGGPPSVKLGGRRLVAEADLVAYADRLRTESSR
jgi:excisionase family DNA binding protein